MRTALLLFFCVVLFFALSPRTAAFCLPQQLIKCFSVEVSPFVETDAVFTSPVTALLPLIRAAMSWWKWFRSSFVMVREAVAALSTVLRSGDCWCWYPCHEPARLGFAPIHNAASTASSSGIGESRS